jgi:CelD/BcsL family acetyltransferase involved in cellulose biosynthesis
VSDAASRSPGVVEIVDWRALATHEAKWRNLSARASEPNAFAEPEFLLPALQHLAGRRVRVLLIWRDDKRGALIGLAAIVLPRLPFALARLWRSEQAALPAILLDRRVASEALAAMLDWLGARRTRPLGLRLPYLTADGPVAAGLAALAKLRGLTLQSAHRRSRAVLIVDQGARFEARLDKRRRKEWGRQRRRLLEQGRLEAHFGADSASIEGFLALEQQGWKGARGSALGAEGERAAFARDALTRFAARGALIVHILTLEGESIAAGVVLRTGARGFFWKTAYDERYAAFSPGVQATLELSRHLEGEPGLTLVDSCAIADHPMIERAWRDRIELVDLALPATGRARAVFVLMAAVEHGFEALKRRVRRLIVAARASRHA